MDKDSAKRLVQETLQSSFNKERFVYLVKNLLNRIEGAPFTYKGNLIFDDFADSIKLVERVGKYRDPEEKLIDILIVYLKRKTLLERARTKQRNFVAKYLKGSRGGVLKDAALVAFVSPDGDDWRFSLVRMEYKFDEKGKIKEEFTPARRYSFLVGKNENSHTAQSRLLPLLLNAEAPQTLKDLENAFSVEKVTKEFFEKYRDLFLRLKEALDAVVKNDTKIKADFEGKGVDTIDFTKKLLGQIVFLYFLQKKGWFGVKRGAKWGSGSNRFLRELFEKQHGNYTNFFNDILEPLFYEALRLERPSDYYSRFDCRIPFLNGGLFDPINDYDWPDTDILLPDDIFSNKRKTKEGDIGNGILDVFDRYNFTVKEDEPLEKEVAIDPEMLGKVFENLLAVKDRKSKGTYYTPREIVHYMCQESLAHYLATELDSKVSKGDIETLIKYGESVVEHDSRVVNEGRETKTYAFKLPQSVRKHAKLIDEKLASIRVCDPAVGSGAFPVGMMNEIVRTRNGLTPYIGKGGKRRPYHFKRHAIQNCLYGVDIDPGAVEIAKLRLWLSLIVDEEERERIQPLPNLDYKIVQGNSLLSVEKDTLFAYQDFSKLKGLKRRYFNETNPRKKREYKERINKLLRKITNLQKDFDFEVYFSEVFHENGGFDVVIANPPYIEFKKLPRAFKDIYRRMYVSARGKYDIYVLFIESSHSILRDQGLMIFINPTTFLKKDYGAAIRRFILEHFQIREIFDFADLQVFEEVTNYTGLFFLRRQPETFFEFLYHKYKSGSRDLDAIAFTRTLRSNVSDEFKDVIKVTSNRLSHQGWDFHTQMTSAILDKLRLGGHDLLEETHAIFQGIASGKDEVFYVTEQAIKQYSLERELLYRLLKGQDIKRYTLNWSGYHVIYLYDEKSHVIPESKIKDNYPHTYQYLVERRSLLAGRGYFDSSTKKWYELWNQRKLANFLKMRIVTPEISDRNNFAVTKSFFGNTKTYHLLLKNSRASNYSFFLGLLNSKLIEFYYHSVTSPHAGGFYAYKTQFLKKIPVRNWPQHLRVPVVALVDQILAVMREKDYSTSPTKQAKVRENEKRIDQHIYKLYDLTPEEIKIVEGYGRK